MREGSVSVHRTTERIVVQTGTVGYSIYAKYLSYTTLLHAFTYYEDADEIGTQGIDSSDVGKLKTVLKIKVCVCFPAFNDAHKTTLNS